MHIQTCSEPNFNISNTTNTLTHVQLPLLFPVLSNITPTWKRKVIIKINCTINQYLSEYIRLFCDTM